MQIIKKGVQRGKQRGVVSSSGPKPKPKPAKKKLVSQKTKGGSGPCNGNQRNSIWSQTKHFGPCDGRSRAMMLRVYESTTDLHAWDYWVYVCSFTLKPFIWKEISLSSPTPLSRSLISLSTHHRRRGGRRSQTAAPPRRKPKPPKKFKLF
jgi:hypothetical protein